MLSFVTNSFQLSRDILSKNPRSRFILGKKYYISKTSIVWIFSLFYIEVSETTNIKLQTISHAVNKQKAFRKQKENITISLLHWKSHFKNYSAFVLLIIKEKPFFEIGILTKPLSKEKYI